MAVEPVIVEPVIVVALTDVSPVKLDDNDIEAVAEVPPVIPILEPACISLTTPTEPVAPRDILEPFILILLFCREALTILLALMTPEFITMLVPALN